MSTRRIRPDNGTIRELNIRKEKLEVLQKVESSPQATDDIKKLMIKKFAEVSPCCVCGGIPSLEVVYDVEFASRVERDCQACANRVFSAMTSSKHKRAKNNDNRSKTTTQKLSKTSLIGGVLDETGIVSIIWQLLDTISKHGHYVFIS